MHYFYAFDFIGIYFLFVHRKYLKTFSFMLIKAHKQTNPQQCMGINNSKGRDLLIFFLNPGVEPYYFMFVPIRRDGVATLVPLPLPPLSLFLPTSFSTFHSFGHRIPSRLTDANLNTRTHNRAHIQCVRVPTTPGLF